MFWDIYTICFSVSNKPPKNRERIKHDLEEGRFWQLGRSSFWIHVVWLVICLGQGVTIPREQNYQEVCTLLKKISEECVVWNKSNLPMAAAFLTGQHSTLQDLPFEKTTPKGRWHFWENRSSQQSLKWQAHPNSVSHFFPFLSNDIYVYIYLHIWHDDISDRMVIESTYEFLVDWVIFWSSPTNQRTPFAPKRLSTMTWLASGNQERRLMLGVRKEMHRFVCNAFNSWKTNPFVGHFKWGVLLMS